MSSELNTQFAVSRSVHKSARYLDDHDFDSYLQLFTSDGEYSISTRAPELAEPMIWMQQTRDELAERFQSMTEHEWEIARIEQSRIISVDTIELNGSDALSSSSFVLYHTDAMGVSSCYAVGRYEDKWINATGACLLARREVLLKTRQLSVLSPLPL